MSDFTGSSRFASPPGRPTLRTVHPNGFGPAYGSGHGNGYGNGYGHPYGGGYGSQPGVPPRSYFVPPSSHPITPTNPTPCFSLPQTTARSNPAGNGGTATQTSATGTNTGTSTEEQVDFSRILRSRVMTPSGVNTSIGDMMKEHLRSHLTDNTAQRSELSRRVLDARKSWEEIEERFRRKERVRQSELIDKSSKFNTAIGDLADNLRKNIRLIEGISAIDSGEMTLDQADRYWDDFGPTTTVAADGTYLPSLTFMNVLLIAVSQSLRVLVRAFIGTRQTTAYTTFRHNPDAFPLQPHTIGPYISNPNFSHNYGPPPPYIYGLDPTGYGGGHSAMSPVDRVYSSRWTSNGQNPTNPHLSAYTEGPNPWYSEGGASSYYSGSPYSQYPGGSSGFYPGAPPQFSNHGQNTFQQGTTPATGAPLTNGFGGQQSWGGGAGETEQRQYMF
ncbi:hypothetical protein IAR55_000734 [Kwoniella newhampshirensis]|uniref:Uncharacterized protein n=1 Tax=Kwoniella newhampshirensis TaxID=1651941 RepID=A0AAW0Z3U0_9TREE